MTGAFLTKKSVKNDVRHNNHHNPNILYNPTSNTGDYEDAHSLQMLKKPTFGTKVSKTLTIFSAPLIKAWQFLRRRTGLTFWICVGLVVGILIGKFAPDFAVKIGPLGTVFIRMIECIVVCCYVMSFVVPFLFADMLACNLPLYLQGR